MSKNYARLSVGLSNTMSQLHGQNNLAPTDTLKEYQLPGEMFQRSIARPKKLDPVPWYPSAQLVKDEVERLSNGRLFLAYESSPTSTFWILDNNDPKNNLKIWQGQNLFAFQYILWVISIIFLVSAVSAYWIAGKITRPLSDLSEQANKLALGKELHRIEVGENSAPEIQTLVSALNSMRSSLDKVLSDREQILASVTHDVRTPLSRLNIALDLMVNQGSKDVEFMKSDVAEMSNILEQFVESSKLEIEAGEPWQIGNINTFVREVRNKYLRAHVAITLQTTSEKINILYKPLALTRLLYNLIDNAYRYGTGDIDIQVDANEKNVWVQISNPINVDLPDTTVFRVTPQQEGRKLAGLGLKIAKQFADVHEAELSESTIDGVKTYTIRFSRAI